MRILPTNRFSETNVSQNFTANLWVDKSVEKIIEPNKKAFLNAAKKCDEWLRHEQGQINSTMIIRKNTALKPQVAFEHPVTKVSYAYPHEDSGHEITEMVKEYEDLEFEMNGRKFGFWFNKNSNEENLFNYFKNMFYN